MTVTRSILLFILAALAEIGGAWLIWQGVREHRGWIWMGAGTIALGVYGFVATLQPDAHFGRILAAYGGVFVAGSLLWGMALDGFRPDRWISSAPSSAWRASPSSCTHRVARNPHELGNPFHRRGPADVECVGVRDRVRNDRRRVGLGR